ncbi:MAG TPA: hypothetical protein VEF04_08370, partial [Blastocatellia bacterium]|nr:hypothetical protein [Blastocatellia bacterium]
DRSIRIYNAAEGAFMEHLFGHTARICAIDNLSRERCVSCSEDSSVRLWKIPEETHLLLSGKHVGPIDCVKMLNETTYVSGSQEGTLALWSATKRRPVSVVLNAHSPGHWIESLTALPNSDLVASGSDDGLIRLWRVDLDRSRLDVDPVAALPCVGHVNALAIAPLSASFIVAGVGQEPRLGRWRVSGEAKNVVQIFRLPNVQINED